MTHPVKKLDKAAREHANKFPKKPEYNWWAEYRYAYAKAAGVDDEVPHEPDADLQAYLRDIDEKIDALRVEWRAKQ